MSTTTLPFHPLADIFPLMEGAEFDALVTDIKAHGQHARIVLKDGMILDGRNRYRACLAAGIEPMFACEAYSNQVTDPVAYVISANIKRRHLTTEQKRELIAKLIKASPEKSNRQIASTAQVDHKTVAAVRVEKQTTGEIPQLKKTIGKDGKTRRRPAKKAKSKISKASSELANLVIDTVLPKVEAGKTAATSADDAAACDLDLAEQLQAAKIKIAGLESEVEELKAENAELRAKLEAAACTPAGVPPENGERPTSPSTNGKGKFDKHIIEDPEQPGMFRVKRPDGTVTIPVTHGRAQFVADQLWG